MRDIEPTDLRYADAERRVNRLGGWAAHLLAFLLVNVGLFAQSGFDPTAGHFWGWGIGLLAHTFTAVGPTASIKRRLIERQVTRDTTHRGP